MFMTRFFLSRSLRSKRGDKGRIRKNSIKKTLSLIDLRCVLSSVVIFPCAFVHVRTLSERFYCFIFANELNAVAFIGVDDLDDAVVVVII